MIQESILVLHICVALAQPTGWVKYANYDLRISSHSLMAVDTYSADNCAKLCTARSSEINIAKFTSRAVCVCILIMCPLKTIQEVPKKLDKLKG